MPEMPQPQPQLDNRELNYLLSIVISLGNEVFVLRDRMSIIEKTLESKGSITRADIENFKYTPEDEELNRRECDEFMGRLFRCFNEKQ